MKYYDDAIGVDLVFFDDNVSIGDLVEVESEVLEITKIYPNLRVVEAICKNGELHTVGFKKA